jgi:SAM-dependent methyltransferase
MEFPKNRDLHSPIEISALDHFDVGSDRFSQVISLDEMDTGEIMELGYKLAVREGLFKGGFFEFLKKFYEFDSSPEPAHLSGEIEKHILLLALTVGSSEPTYLELLGQEGIQELRSRENINCLLVGSLGKYSTREFSQMIDKINPSSSKHVIELNEEHLPRYEEIKPANRLNLAIMNGLEMGIKDNSMDLVCTNYLLHHLADNESFIDPSRSNIEKLLSEIYRVLKPGGRLLLSEMMYGDHRWEFDPDYSMRKEIVELGRAAGFRNIKYLQGTLNYFLAPNYLSAKIDQNGAATYVKPVLLDEGENFSANFRK